MKLVFDEDAWEQYLYWQSRDPDILLRINTLIREIQLFLLLMGKGK